MDMRALLVGGLLASLLATSAAFNWRDRLQAAENSDDKPQLLVTQLLKAQRSGFSKQCNNTAQCCDIADVCHCYNNLCKCDADDFYWQSERECCVIKGELGSNCTVEPLPLGEYTCRPDHSTCQHVDGRGMLCECQYPYYPDKERRECILVQSPFFTTTIIVSVCVLFAAVAIGVIMQIRSNIQRRIYEQHYRRHADLDAMIAAQRRARQRRAARRDPARRYSEEAAPDEPPPPYTPIFTTRSSGDWGKLPSYQEAVTGAPDRQNEAFEMEESGPSASEASSVPTLENSAGAEEAVATSPVVSGTEIAAAGEEFASGAEAPRSTASLSAECAEPPAGSGAQSTALQPHLTYLRTSAEPTFRRVGSL